AVLPSSKPHRPTRPVPEVTGWLMLAWICTWGRATFHTRTSSILPPNAPVAAPVDVSGHGGVRRQDRRGPGVERRPNPGADPGEHEPAGHLRDGSRRPVGFRGREHG